MSIKAKQGRKDNWTDEDESLLRDLVKKRLATKQAFDGHDFKFICDMLDGEDGENVLVEALNKAEVKRDYKAGTTGNIFIEHKQGSKDSGITTTKADYWLFLLSDEVFNNEVFIGIKTDRLKRLLNNITWEVNGGDNNASKGKLLKLTKLIK